ncbi:MAG: hypothetical protein KZQ89_02330 [Candidatus Thiodiazotropha sp. (ex Lucinoma kastoroae)]|nr:hypothetical protein [Candidatus Thiodiazotropha sp. (ex Rostrolucina anterorostrata)]MCU7846837.1 hypothetical protein [Candidatus Thiodiazotropha sp. (ex Lucinoma kastoroae)]MCU7861016.1 hypothetical protein [Candidatus Thiodiazotropha sp. (ex Lucinoma kastoroae)]
MILRRIYMLIPTTEQAGKVANDLMLNRVNRQHIHTMAKQGVDISGLPEATVRQRSDTGAQLERWFWDLNLLIFFAALLLLLFALWSAEWVWVLGCLTVMAVTVLSGYYFASHVPHTHLADCRVPLQHGEILLLVDVPRWRITEVERSIRQLHPEVEIGGVGWGYDALGI